MYYRGNIYIDNNLLRRRVTNGIFKTKRCNKKDEN